VAQVLELPGLAVAHPSGQPQVACVDGGTFGREPVALGVGVMAGVECGPSGELAGVGNGGQQGGLDRVAAGPVGQRRRRLGEPTRLHAQHAAAGFVID
jgi:hypothetical protein